MKKHDETPVADCRGDGEGGAVLIIVAMCTILLMTLATWVIDLSLIANSRENAQHAARLSCLAAIEAHFASNDPLIADRVADALTRAKGVSFTSVMLSNPDYTKANYRRQVKAATDTANPGATLTPGVFYYDLIRTNQLTGAPLATPVNPCTGGANPPCFVPTDLTTPDAAVSAYRIEGPFYQGITHKLGSIIGTGSSPALVAATCAVVPRRLAFVVDMSASMTRMTHRFESIANQTNAPYVVGRSSEYAYFLQADNLATYGTLPTNPKYDPVWAFISSTTDRGAGSGSTGANPAPPPTNTAAFSRVHFRDDYVKLRTLSDADYGSQFVGKHPNPGTDPTVRIPRANWFRIDKFAHASYTGPEPLTTTFFGIRQAVSAFRDRAVAGDQIGVIVYDQNLSWPRIFLPTNDFDYLERVFNSRDGLAGVITTDDADNDNVVDVGVNLTDLNAPGFIRGVRHSLFPSVLQNGDNAQTQTMTALARASTMLNASGSAATPSQDAIILVTDGRANCNASGTVCANQFSSYTTATNELLGNVTANLVGRNVPLHIVMVGEESGPHTIAVARDPSALGNDTATTTECLSDDEARRTFRPFVAGGKAAGGNPQDIATATTAENNAFFIGNPAPDGTVSPFFQANDDAYDLASLTQGLWAPLRPPAPLDGLGQCPAMTCTRVPKRQLLDPLCRTMQQQITDYVDRIIGANPYMIVDVE